MSRCVPEQRSSWLREQSAALRRNSGFGLSCKKSQEDTIWMSRTQDSPLSRRDYCCQPSGWLQAYPGYDIHMGPPLQGLFHPSEAKLNDFFLQSLEIPTDGFQIQLEFLSMLLSVLPHFGDDRIFRLGVKRRVSG